MSSTGKPKKKRVTVLKTILILLLILIVAVAVYVAYAFIACDRLEDNMDLEVVGSAGRPVETGQEICLVSYNIGFGAYSDDFSFFMDGGKESRARSPEAVRENVGGALNAVKALDPDLLFIQEVDTDGTRSHHIDEREIVKAAFPQHASVFSRNYDSPYLMWPLKQPHGANKAGIMTLSKFGIASSLRRSLPIEKGPAMMVDLDRCYSVSRIPTENGKELALYNFHLSAYTSDGKIAEDQLVMLFEDMQKDVDAGNYVIAGGDFNKDLLGNSAEIFGVSCEDMTWAQPIPQSIIPESFQIVVPFHEEEKVASCRNADRPYDQNNFLITIDGFIVSENVQVLETSVLDTQFKWSDHNPVYLQFALQG